MNTSLLILVSALAIGAAQMTFSDGWEKREPSRVFAHNYAHQKEVRSGGHSIDYAHEDEMALNDEHTKNSVTDLPGSCMDDYWTGIREIHAAMVELYSRFEACENTMVNPLLPRPHEKNSPRM